MKKKNLAAVKRARHLFKGGGWFVLIFRVPVLIGEAPKDAAVAELLHKRKGNCDAQAALMAVLLRRMGYEAQLVQGTFVREEGAEPVDHAWVYALVGGEGVYFDPLYGGSFAEHAEDYCMASAALLKETHQWDENALQ